MKTMLLAAMLALTATAASAQVSGMDLELDPWTGVAVTQLDDDREAASIGLVGTPWPPGSEQMETTGAADALQGVEAAEANEAAGRPFWQLQPGMEELRR